MKKDVEKIVQILRRCDEGWFCDGCDYKDEADSTGVCKVMSDAADMIERLSAELEKQEQVIADLESALNQSEFEVKFWQTMAED